jgi:hypothetical protein
MAERYGEDGGKKDTATSLSHKRKRVTTFTIAFHHHDHGLRSFYSYLLNLIVYSMEPISIVELCLANSPLRIESGTYYLSSLNNNK